MYKKNLLGMIIILFCFSSIYSAGSDLTISASTSWAPGIYNYGTLTINNNSILTLQGNTTSNSGVIINADNIVIESGSKISANGQGYPGTTGNGQGPGGATYNPSGGGYGASYSGIGGKGRYGSAGPAYGSLELPNQLGSSGAAYFSNQPGGNGGGSITLNVTGTIDNNGTISADGNGGVSNGGSGSGGSVLIDTNTFSGNGLVSVKGGTGGSSTYDGGGGGGRIAIYYNTNSYTGSYTTFGGTPGNYPYSGYGSSGTTYLKDKSYSKGDVLIDNNNYNSGYTYISVPSSDYSFRNLSITNLGDLINVDNLDVENIDITNNGRVISTGYVNVTNSINGETGPSYNIIGTGRINLVDTFTFPTQTNVLASLTLNNFDISGGVNTGLSVTGNYVSVVSDLTVDTLSVSGSLTTSGSLFVSDLDSVGDITVQSGGRIGQITGDTTGLEIDAPNLYVNSGGSVNVNAQGYLGTTGHGQGPGGATYSGSGGGYGASYAGVGGVGRYGSRGSNYGSLELPNQLGSSGAAYFSNQPGGNGGGFILLNITGTIDNDGTISANGGGGVSNGGSGSGGSILIDTNTFSGSGLVSANGGTGGSSTYDAGGGGGRIAIYYDTNSYGGSYTTFGGNPGNTGYSGYGSSGTTYLKDNSYPKGDVLIDNNNINSNARTSRSTYISVPNSDYNFRNLTITNLGYLINVDNLDVENVDITGSGDLIATGYVNVSNSINGETGPSYNIVGPGAIDSGTSLILPDPSHVVDSFTLTDFSLFVNSLTVTNTLTIGSGGILSHPRGDVNGLQIIANNINVNSGGSISANGKGYQGTTGHGLGTGGGVYSASGGGYGGSYAGFGGHGRYGSLGSLYGNETYPTDLGSSAAAYFSNQPGGSGGGYILLNVTGTLDVSGTISSNGVPGVTNGGAGSGGSVLIFSDSVLGSGSITANGGNGVTTYSGGGGGGRIALYCSDNSFGGTFTSLGGNAGNPSYSGDGNDGTTHQSLSCTPSAAYVLPTPEDGIKLSSGQEIIFNISDGGIALTGCKMNINGVNYTMTYSGGYCNYTYSLDTEFKKYKIDFVGYYEEGGSWKTLEERTGYFFIEPPRAFPSFGFGSFVGLILILVFFIF